jgi:hypothetical protein
LAKNSKHEKKPASSSSSVEAAHITGTAPAPVHFSRTGHRDDRPGPAWRTISGTVKQITADTYTVEDYEGNQVQLYVGKGTKHLRGNKKVGDTVRAEITRGGFANSIQ